MAVVILEDNEDRLCAMREIVPHGVYFDHAGKMIEAMDDWLPTARLISLDHDLPFHRDKDDVLHDNGTGREVADVLSKRTPTCPIIVHTSNYQAMLGMVRVLKDGGWRTTVVRPERNTVWIERDWLRVADDLLHGGELD